MHEHTLLSHHKTGHTYLWSIKYRDRTEGPLAGGGRGEWRSAKPGHGSDHDDRLAKQSVVVR